MLIITLLITITINPLLFENLKNRGEKSGGVKTHMLASAACVSRHIAAKSPVLKVATKLVGAHGTGVLLSCGRLPAAWINVTCTPLTAARRLKLPSTVESSEAQHATVFIGISSLPG